MDSAPRDFLMDLLAHPSPSGFETSSQRVWLDYVSAFADDTWTDSYGNAFASHGDGAPTLVFTGHVDEIGLIVRRIDDDGFVHPGSIGGADRTVSRGQHVAVHTDAGTVPGVIAQTAVHLRDSDSEELVDINEQRIDIGAADGDHATDLVETGDPITIASSTNDLAGTRIAGRGLDDRVGVWAAAEGLRRAVMNDVQASVIAVSTVQEEIGLQGARMVGHDLAADAIIGIDVCHALDYPTAPENQGSGTTLGGGPTIARGSGNHPRLVSFAREAAASAGVEVQLRAAGSGTGTDIDALYTQQGGIPSMYLGVPTRYMHTPTETIDTADLDDVATLLGAIADRAEGVEGFAVDI